MTRSALFLLLIGCAGDASKDDDPGLDDSASQHSGDGDDTSAPDTQGGDDTSAPDTHETDDTSAPDTHETDDTSALPVDSDGDGSPASEDCDDADAAIYPGASESCDGLDDDCDGEIDEGLTSTWYGDADDDGYGGTKFTVEACDAPDGYVADASDCDDLDDAVSPGATERCDGLDDDCDGEIDESGASGETTWYEDDDGDGWGDAAVLACDAPAGTVTLSGDCDDADASVSPSASESCDGVDDDCDGDTDEDDAIDVETWYADVDDDGYGDPLDSVTSCSAPTGYQSDDTDCDDTDATVYPGAAEVCDGIQTDCDRTDDGCDGACDAGDAAGGDDCDGVCGADDAAGGVDCDELCADDDEAASPDCLGAPVVTISPDGPDTDDDLQASADVGGVTWSWYLDGVELASLAGESEIPAALTSRGQVWQARATSGGLTGQASVTIGNAPPVASVSISPTDPLDSDVLQAVVTSDDPDGDSVDYTYEWTVDGEAISETSDQLDGPTWLSGGETVTVTVTPNDGTEDGEPVTASTTVSEGCSYLDYSVSGGCVKFSTTSTLNLSTTAYTIEAWIYPESGSTYRRLMDYDTTTAAWKVYMTSATTLVIKVNDSGSASTTVTPETWQHVAFVYASSTMSIYVDGVKTYSSAYSYKPSGTNPFYIGAASGCGAQWSGAIGPIRLSNTARYTDTFTPEWGWTTDSSTVGLWNMTEGSGTTLYDSSSNANNGTLTGGPSWDEDVCP